VWIGASDGSNGPQLPKAWHWIGGPQRGVVFWRGGLKGKDGHPVAGIYENWKPGEPNNNGIPEGNISGEDLAGAGLRARTPWERRSSLNGWNDVTFKSHLRAVIEYDEGFPCRSSESLMTDPLEG
jgi:hypothetical protein